MQPTTNRFSGVYLWDIPNKTSGNVLLVKNVPQTIVDLLNKQTQSTKAQLLPIFNGGLEAGNLKFQQVVVTDDRYGNHCHLTELTVNAPETLRELGPFIHNPHGTITSTNADGLDANIKVYSPITRFFKSIGNFFKKLFYIRFKKLS